MNIAMIGQKGIPAKSGGVERHVHDLAISLSKRNIDVTVYNRFWYDDEHFFDTKKHICIKKMWSIRTKHFDTITHSFLSTLHAMWAGHDIIHYHGVGPSLVSFLPKIFTPKIKIITTFHSMDRKHQKWGFFARMILRLGEYTTCKISDTVIAVSRTIQQYVRDVYDTDAVYVPNAVEIVPGEKDETLLKTWDLLGHRYILMVSRLIPHKGAHLLIEAWNELQKTDPNLVLGKKLVIVGDGSYTENYVQMLRKIAKNEPSIIFTGYQNKKVLQTFFENALFQVHPSGNEGLPICVLEGMSFKKPVLLSDIPEHKDILTDKSMFFRHGSVKDLKKKLKSTLQMTDEELAQKGTENFTRIKQEYTWDIIEDTLIDIYESQIEEKPQIKTAPILEEQELFF